MAPRIIRVIVTLSLIAPGVARAQYALNGGYPSNGFGYVQHHAGGTIVVQGNQAIRYGHADPALSTPPIYGYGGYGSYGYRPAYTGGYQTNHYGRRAACENDSTSLRYEQAQRHSFRNGYDSGRGANGYRSGYNRGYAEGVRQGQAQATHGYGYGSTVGTIRPYSGGYLYNNYNTPSAGNLGYGTRRVVRNANGGLAYDGR